MKHSNKFHIPSLGRTSVWIQVRKVNPLYLFFFQWEDGSAPECMWPNKLRLTGRMQMCRCSGCEVSTGRRWRILMQFISQLRAAPLKSVMIDRLVATEPATLAPYIQSIYTLWMDDVTYSATVCRTQLLLIVACSRQLITCQIRLGVSCEKYTK